MRMWAGILTVILVASSPAAADIYMWRDGQGVKHYTNERELVPADESASLVLHEPARSVEETASRADSAERERIRAREAEISFDEQAVASAYAEGYQRALVSAQQQVQAPPVNVQIIGPMVAASAVGGTGGGDGYGYYPSWLDYNSPALLTTSFDRGRSRHLTLRMLMQDQFAIDRAGPYLIVDRFPPRGPNLTTVMPRGLPWFVRPGSGVVDRVITH
jgi:hypothetical protein